MRRRRPISVLLRFVVAIAALWLLAGIAVRVGVGQSRAERVIGERLGLDAAIGRSRLCGFAYCALDVEGRLPNSAPDADSVFTAQRVRIGPRKIHVQDATFQITERPDGSTVPASFATCKPDLDGTAQSPCPIRVLTALGQAVWPPSGIFHGRADVENAAILYRDREGALHPVFTGLDWRRQWFRFTLEPECRHSMYTSARFRSFGPAVAPDGRPTDGGAGSVQWFDRGPQPDGAPSISIVWGKRQPCEEESEDRSPESEVESPVGPDRRNSQTMDGVNDVNSAESERRADRETGGEP
jgi:hypothetical protein